MNNILLYLSQDYAWYAVVLPGAFVLFWLATEARTNPPTVSVVYHWMLCVLGTYWMSWWIITPTTISLHMVDVFFFYLAIYLYLGLKMTASTAFSLTYLSIWIPDMIRARELVGLQLAEPNTYYFGVGGAGMGDGLCIVPLISAALVHYVAWRRKSLARVKN